MQNISSYKFVCIIITLLAFSSEVANASPADTTSHRYKIYMNAGVYFPETTTTFQFNGNHGLGTLIYVEDLLHLDRHPLLITANMFWKITKRSGVSARFFHYSVDGNFEGLDREITIQDTVINVGAKINTHWSNDYFGLNYNYAVFSKNDWSAGLSVGLRNSSLKIKLDYELNNSSGEYSESLNVPIILGGLFAEGYLAPRLRGSYSFEMFRLSLDGISGLVYENRFALEYYIIKNLGLGFSYNQILYKINDVPFSDRFDGTISYVLNGIQLNLHARF
jgi:hypothetical protein